MKLKEKINYVTVKNSNSETLLGKLFETYNLYYFRKNFYKKFYKEHLRACREILESFLDKNREDKNHTVLYAPTQSGKTSCMTLLTDVISEAEFKRLLNINLIVYLTGDNQCGLTLQSKQRFEEETNSPTFFVEDDLSTPEDYIDDTVINVRTEQENGKIPVIFIKQSDCKKAIALIKRYNDFFDNTLIMIDESHYGTRNKTTQVNWLLEEMGCDMANSHKRLVERNIYILSVSATPWNELFSDENFNSDKYTVRYQPGEGYKGFNTFIHNNNIKGMIQGIDNVDDFSNFLKDQYKKIKKIGTNIGKAIIMRINEKGIKLPKKQLEELIENAGFEPLILSSKDGRIDYKTVDKFILAADKCGTPVAIIIYEAYKHGISIDGKAKKEVVTVYDFRKSKTGDATDATEQGLLGRMCGYDDVDLDNLEIFINQTHYDGLISHNDNRNASYPSPILEVINKVECSKEEWKTQDANKRFNNIIIKKEKTLHFKIDEFLEKNVNKYGKEEIHFMLTNFEKSNRLKRGIVNNIIKDFVREAIASKKIKVNLKDERFIDGRRKRKTKDAFADSLVGEKYETIHYNKTNHDIFKNSEKNIDCGEYCWAGVINSIGKNGKPTEKGVDLIISYGIPKYAKIGTTKSATKRKLYSGYTPKKTPINSEETLIKEFEIAAVS